MPARCSRLKGSALLSLIVLQSLVSPLLVRGGGRRSFGILSPVMGSPETPAAGICATFVIIHGYKCHEHEVTTEDGYILSLQRIPEGRRGGGGGGSRPPVILQHGVLVDGMTWLLNQAEQNLPFILAENGFDVWIANARGTPFSRKHTSLDPRFAAFWDWTWDELVIYDLPAVVNFVYQQTGRTQKINYVGHSLGTLIMLASLSEGRLLDQLRSAALLSPVAYVSHMTTALGVIAAKSLLGEATTLLGLAEFNPKSEDITKFLHSLCMNPGIDCSDLLTQLTGQNCCLNSSTVDLFFKYEPQSTSTKNMMHLAQTVRYGILSKYNYGSGIKNLAHYGEIFPPIYNLSNIPRSFPLFMSYGGRDALSDIRDVQDLLDIFKLHNVDKLHVQFVKEYAHADFIMGINAKDIVYNSIVSFFKQQQ